LNPTQKPSARQTKPTKRREENLLEFRCRELGRQREHMTNATTFGTRPN